MDPIFTEFGETDKITEAWMRANIMILSVTCVFVALWYHLCLSGKGPGFKYNNPFIFEKKLSLKSANSVKTFWENSIEWNVNIKALPIDIQRFY